MNKGIDISFVREAYQRMSDEDLKSLLTTDANGLTEEAMQVVQEEMAKRKLDPQIMEAIKVQQQMLTENESDFYCSLIRRLPCPATGSTDTPLTATQTVDVVSIIVMTNYRKKTHIGTPETLRKLHDQSIFRSMLLGWWGIPWGIVRTIQAIGVNLKNKRDVRTAEINTHLRNFVQANIGVIEMYKDDTARLQELIYRNNKG